VSDFSDAVRETIPTFQSAFGEPVTYSRSGETDIEPTVTFGEQAVDVADQDGVYFRVPEVEMRIKRTDLDFGAGPVAPNRGDTVTRSDGRVYDVVHRGRFLADWDEWRVPLTERT